MPQPVTVAFARCAGSGRCGRQVYPSKGKKQSTEIRAGKAPTPHGTPMGLSVFLGAVLASLPRNFGDICFCCAVGHECRRCLFCLCPRGHPHGPGRGAGQDPCAASTSSRRSRSVSTPRAQRTRLGTSPSHSSCTPISHEPQLGHQGISATLGLLVLSLDPKTPTKGAPKLEDAMLGAPR